MVKRIGFILVCLACLSMAFTSVLSAPKGGTLQLWTGYAERLPVYKAAIAEYTKSHPVAIEITPFELRQSEQKVAIALPAGTAPDLFCPSNFLLHQFAGEKLLDPAPANIKNYVKRNWDKACIDAVTVNGEIYGIPEVQGYQLLFYNLDYFKEAGLAKPPQTLDELMAYARKLAKYDEKGNLVRSGISLRISGGGSGIAQKFEIFLFANGAAAVSPGKTPGKWKANFANEAGYKALNFHLQALYKYKVDSFDIKHDEEAFLLGLAAMFNRETYVIGDAKKRAPNLNYGVAQVVGDTMRGTNLNIDSWVVPASSKNKELAWDFLNFMSQDKYAVMMMKEVGWTVTKKNVNYNSVYAIEPHFKQALTGPKNMQTVVTPYAAGENEALTKFSARLVEAFADPSLMDNKDKIMAFLNNAAKEVNDVLKTYNEYGE